MRKIASLICSLGFLSFSILSSINADDQKDRDRRDRSENKGDRGRSESKSDRGRERKEGGGKGERREHREGRKEKGRSSDASGGQRRDFKQSTDGQGRKQERRSHSTQERPARKTQESRRWNFQNNIQQGEDSTRRRVQKFLQDHPSRVERRGQKESSRVWQNRSVSGHHLRNWDQSLRDRGDWKYNDSKAQNLAKTTRDRFKRNYSDRRQKWFNRNFWASRRHHPVFYNYNYDWWNVASVGTLSAWLGWQARPYFYSYDQGYWGPTYYSDSYYSSNDYTQRARLIDSYQSTNQEWLPLGVFTLVDTVTSAEPNIYLQLAVNREGFIGGTFYNVTTDQSYDLEGVVQSDSQRVAWKVDNRADSPVFETGIYNLSNSQQPLRLYFPDGSVRNVLMVRLDDDSSN